MKETSRQNTVDTNLLIKVYSDGISYALTDEKEHVILQQTINVPSGKMKDIHFFEHFFEQTELRVLGENVTIIFENSNYMLIPSDLFQEKDIRSMYELKFGKERSETISYSLLPKWGIHLIYAVPEQPVVFFGNKYPEAEIEHHIFRLMKRKVTKQTNCVYANLRKDAVDLIVVKENTPMLANSYRIKTNEDICYFVLNAYELLELDTALFPLKILSENPIAGELVSMIKSYVFNTESY